LSTWSDRSMSANVADLATTAFDLVIVDPAPSGLADIAAITARVNALKFRPNGDRRLVLAPLSIAEAEDHRAYWNSRWSPPKLTAVVRRPGDQTGPAATTPKATEPSARLVTSAVTPVALPSWLAEEAAERSGQWRVRYWMADWQSILFGSDGAMLDTILAAGFDGIVLDRADAHAHWSKHHPDARPDMIALVENMSRYAREKAPGFIVVLKDAEDLLDTTRIRGAVDAVIKQDLLFSRDGHARVVDDRGMAASIAHLKRAQRDGLVVLVAESPSNDAARVSAGDRLLAYGFVPSIGQRQDKRRTVD
jgi:cysteinyl-tRNA synthetase, unknown class